MCISTNQGTTNAKHYQQNENISFLRNDSSINSGHDKQYDI